MLLSRPLRSLAVCSLILLLGVSLHPCVGLGEAPTFGSGCSLLSLHSPPLCSFPCSLALPLSFSPLILSSLCHSLSPHPTPPLFSDGRLDFFFPLMALSLSSAPYFVLAAPTLPRNLSAATGNSVHMHICVLSILCWYQIRNVCQSKALPSSLKVHLRWQESPVATWAPHSDLNSSL